MRRTFLAVAVVLCLLAPKARGFINPSFTPLDLMQQSEVVLLLEFTNVDPAGEATAAVKEALKGEAEGDQVVIDLLASPFEAQGRALMALIGAGHKQAMLFAGYYPDAGADAAGGDEGMKGFLHLAGQWAVLGKWEDIWEMEKIDARMLGTWAGSTDMLLRAVRYILDDPDADVPVRSGVSWDTGVQVAQMTGTVSDAQAVDVAGDGAIGLFLACAQGDRLFRWDAGTLADVTERHRLASKSVLAAWGDYNGDGRLDLASWDGEGLTVHLQDEAGRLTPGARLTPDALKGGCIGLATLDSGASGKAALLASTPSWPVLFVQGPGGELEARALGTGEFPGAEMGEAGRCLVADLDDDGLADVLQPLALGGLFYKGKAVGRFEAPVPNEVASGGGRYGACLGDYDADGLPDVFVGGEVRNHMWHNVGAGHFAERLDVSGEIAYISKPGGIAAQSGDFNNDGRQDVFLAYGSALSPHLFFNRGFRSFGHARMVDLSEQRLLPQAGEGQQGGCLADFNRDGALDMVVVLRNGECWMFPRKVEEDGGLAVLAALPAGSKRPGPAMVWAWRYERPLGAFVVSAGEPGAFIGADEPGPVMLKWRFQGEEAQETEVIVESGLVRVCLGEQ